MICPMLPGTALRRQRKGETGGLGLFSTYWPTLARAHGHLTQTRNLRAQSHLRMHIRMRVCVCAACLLVRIVLYTYISLPPSRSLSPSLSLSLSVCLRLCIPDSPYTCHDSYMHARIHTLHIHHADHHCAHSGVFPQQHMRRERGANQSCGRNEPFPTILSGSEVRERECVCV